MSAAIGPVLLFGSYGALVWYCVRRGSGRIAAAFVVAPLAPAIIVGIGSQTFLWPLAIPFNAISVSGGVKVLNEHNLLTIVGCSALVGVTFWLVGISTLPRAAGLDRGAA